MFKSLQKPLKSLDFFGKNTTLLFKNHSSYKTTLGFCCSLFLIILSILGAIYFTNLLLSRLNPTITVSQYTNPNPLFLKTQDFFIAFTIQTNKKTPINDEFYANLTMKNTSLKTYALNPKDSCGQIRFESQIFCIELSGILNGTLSDDIKLSIFTKNQQNLKDSPLITLYYPDNLVNNLNYNSPIEGLVQKIELQTITSFTKSLQFTLENVIVQTDEGFMTEDKSKLSFIRAKDPPFESFLNPTTDLFVLKINKSLSNTFVSRNYTKLYTVLANVGGLIKMLWIIIFVIINPFITLQYKKSLMNEIFNFNENEFFFKTRESVLSSKRSIVNDAFVKLQSFVQNFKKEKFSKKKLKKTLGTIKHRQKIDSPTKQVINDVFKIKETNLDISAFESLVYYVCNFRDIRLKKELIQRGSKAINKRIDIAYIIQKIVEIEKLKVLLLDSDQLKLFEYLPKPLLTNNKREKLFSKRVFLNKVQANGQNMNNMNYFHEQWRQLDEDNDKNNILEKVTILSQSFQKIKSKGLMSVLDQKLLDMMDENIKNLLEKTNKSPRIKKFFTETKGKKASLKMLLSLFSEVDALEEIQQKKIMEKIEENDEKELKENTIKENKKRNNEDNNKENNDEKNEESNEKNEEYNKKNEENSEKNEERISVDASENKESTKKWDIKKEINRLNSKFKFFTKDEDSMIISCNEESQKE